MVNEPTLPSGSQSGGTLNYTSKRTAESPNHQSHYTWTVLALIAGLIFLVMALTPILAITMESHPPASENMVIGYFFVLSIVTGFLIFSIMRVVHFARLIRG